MEKSGAWAFAGSSKFGAPSERDAKQRHRRCRGRESSEPIRKLLHTQKPSDACGGEGMALQIFISHTGGRHYADPNALPSYVLFTLLILSDTC